MTDELVPEGTRVNWRAFESESTVALIVDRSDKDGIYFKPDPDLDPDASVPVDLQGMSQDEFWKLTDDNGGACFEDVLYPQEA